MPRMRFRRTWDRRGGRRARHILLSSLVAFLFLLLSACGDNQETLLTPPSADAPAETGEVIDPAADQTGPGAGSDLTASDGQAIPAAAITLYASVADNVDEACVGNKKVTVEPDALLFFCVQVANLGEVPLTDVEIVSRDGNVDPGSLTALQGTFDHIDPGGVLLATLAEPVVNGRLAGEIAEEGLEVWLEATATPVDSAGVELEEVLANSQVLVRVEADGSSTRLAAVMGSGADALFDVGSRMFMAMEFLLPFLALLALVAVLIFWACCRRSLGDQSDPSG